MTEHNDDSTVLSPAVLAFAEALQATLDEQHTYDTSAEAVADTAEAVFNLVADRLGLTGFQASWAALKAYTLVMHYECPLIVLKADDMLYPQYDLPGRLREWMAECEPWLSERASELLRERGDDGMVVDWVREHWRKLAAQNAS